MPRAALLSIHARVAGTEPQTWEDPSLVQLWGPRYAVDVVAASDLALFSLGTMPDHDKGQRRARDTAASLAALTPRVWPGGLLVDGEIEGTWRRAGAVLTVGPWRKLSATERDAVITEAESLPLPDLTGKRMAVRWDNLSLARASYP